jgi:TPR repeat protein
MLKCHIIAVVILVAVSSVARAGIDEARSAYQSGEFEIAFNEYGPLAEQGNAEAQHHIGKMYEEGLGTSKDLSEAAKWFHKAANQRYPDAQYSLGLMYIRGMGVSEDFAQAHMWWSLAAEGGHKRAATQRDTAEKNMTAAQLEESRSMAAEWRAAHP